MVRIIILKNFHNLSDEKMEYQLLDRMSGQRFCRLTDVINIPDRNTIWCFEKRIGQAGALIDISFEYFKYHRIYAKLDVLNVGSKKLVEKSGMRQEAHLLQNERVNGIWSDMYIYAILRDEWKSPMFLKKQDIMDELLPTLVIIHL
ncbi:transposase [Xenorhabdus kozodoii]|uniref:Transposase n=1 Tax=Xenorhabdus kozodoii TaxID=351676 RepID=A0A2D0LEN4_9GAMM|nr:transposase [Xenorhabdus kozodoii]